MSTRLLRELLAGTGPAVYAFYNELDFTATGEPVTWAGPEPAPVWLDIAREYTEQWIHQAQIRDAVGRPGIQQPRLLAPVFATFVRALPHTLRNTAMQDGTSFRLIITGTAGGEWLAVKQSGQWMLGTDPFRLVDATAVIDQDSAWRLFTNGLSQDRVDEVVQMSGDITLARTVLNMVSIIV